MTFSAFVIVGSIPVPPYLIDVIVNLNISSTTLFYVSSILTAVVFVLIGFIKGKVSEQSPWRSSVIALTLGAIAAGLAYFAGDILASWLGIRL